MADTNVLLDISLALFHSILCTSNGSFEDTSIALMPAFYLGGLNTRQLRAF